MSLCGLKLSRAAIYRATAGSYVVITAGIILFSGAKSNVNAMAVIIFCAVSSWRGARSVGNAGMLFVRALPSIKNADLKNWQHGSAVSGDVAAHPRGKPKRRTNRREGGTPAAPCAIYLCLPCVKGGGAERHRRDCYRAKKRLKEPRNNPSVGYCRQLPLHRGAEGALLPPHKKSRPWAAFFTAHCPYTRRRCRRRRGLPVRPRR